MADSASSPGNGSGQSPLADILPSRIVAWRAATKIPWAVSLLIVVVYAFAQVDSAISFLDVLSEPRRYHLSSEEALDVLMSGELGVADGNFLFHLWLAACTLFALIKLAQFGTDPVNWIEFHRFTRVLICVATVFGFPISTGVARLFDLMPSNGTIGIIRFVLTPLMLPLAGLVSVGLGALAVALLTFAFFFLLYDMPLLLFEFLNNRDIQNAIIRKKKQGLADQLTRFHFWLNGQPLPYVPDDSKGARFATSEEVHHVHSPRAPEAMTFGHIGNPLALKTDKHVLIMASTRSGKGVTLIIPHLLRYRGSAFVLDPKGENARATGRHRAALNDKVHYLDPFGISGKPPSRFNPLSRFSPANMEAESKALAAALFVVGERERDHWTAAGQQLLAAIILYVYVSTDIPPEKKDLPTVRRILLGGIHQALDAMTQIDDADGLLRDLAISFIETPEKERGSIISTAQRQTEILDNPFMRACLAATGDGEEVDFKAWREGTMTVYLCLSAPKFPVFNRWLRLVLTSALDEMTEFLDPPTLPVCFMLDELATLGHLAPIENAVGLAAGYGIQLVTVFQDVAQMRDLYKGRWASFIGNAGVRALFNLDDYETAEYWSKFIGGQLVETKSVQADIYGISSGQNLSETMRPLLPPDRIMMDFASGKMLVLAQGMHPIITDRVAYWQDDDLKGLWDDPRGPIAAARNAAPPSPPP